jgi:hypothetical protein
LEQEPKRKKLEELFADEPFLSTTMKARRLHEKLRQLNPANLDDEQPLPTEAFVPDRPARSLSAGEWSRGHKDSVREDTVSLSVAANFLRAQKAGSSPENEWMSTALAERLLRFREEVLSKWVQGLPSRERS